MLVLGIPLDQCYITSQCPTKCLSTLRIKSNDKMEYFRKLTGNAKGQEEAKPEHEVRYSDDKIYPLYRLDTTKTLKSIVVTWTLRFDDVLSAEKLHFSLEKLLEIGDWRKVGGRLQLNVSVENHSAFANERSDNVNSRRMISSRFTFPGNSPRPVQLSPILTVTPMSRFPSTPLANCFRKRPRGHQFRLVQRHSPSLHLDPTRQEIFKTCSEMMYQYCRCM